MATVNIAKSEPKVKYEFGEIESLYATDLVVQGRKTEFVLGFFEVRMPVLNEDEIVKTLVGDCVARVVVPVEQMQAFIDAMQKTLNKVKPKTIK